MLDFCFGVMRLVGRGLTCGAIALLPTVSLANPLLAQSPVSPSVAVMPQGQQVVLNGRSLTIPWMQWQGATGTRWGISDTALRQTFGLQLLNTDSTTVQPVQWFSPGTQSLNLPIRRTNTTRYLDLTDLAQQFGWQWAIAGATLQLNTTLTRIVSIRQSQQPWGDRLVLELAQPTPWQTTQLSQELQVTLNATLDPAIAQSFKAVRGRFLSAVSFTPEGTQTRLRLSHSGTQARVWSLSAPNRIVIDLRPDALIEQNILWAPGLRWRQQILPLGTTGVPTVWLEVNPRQPGISIQPILPNPTQMPGTAPLLTTARQAQAAGAINGGFFNRNRQLPLGAVRSQGRWQSGPILNRGAIAWDNLGNAVFSRLILQETITTSTGQRFSLTHLNSGYVQAGIARYTADWGAAYTTLSDNEIIVPVQNNQVVSQQAIAQAGGTVAIPPNGYLLVLRALRSAAIAFPPGARLQLESNTTPPDWFRYPHIIGAGPLLIQNQQIVLDARQESFSPAFASEQAPRSAIAQRADGTLLFVTTYQRLDGSSLTLLDFAQLLQPLGAVQALNLDGGSSTTLFLGGQIIDRDPRTAARVHNGIGIFLRGNP